MDVLASILLSQPVQLAVAGGMGGAARWIFIIQMDKKIATGQGLLLIVLGIILGTQASPLFQGAAKQALAGFVIDDAKVHSFTAFLTGVLGIGVIGFFIDWWDRRNRPKEEPVDPAPKNP